MIKDLKENTTVDTKTNDKFVKILNFLLKFNLVLKELRGHYEGVQNLFS